MRFLFNFGETQNDLKRLVLIIGALVASNCVLAQIVASMPMFDTYEFDFGTINEADGAVSHVFHLLNNSDKNISISRAIPGCSCISADFLSTPIAPGKMSDVVVSYSPSGAVGDTYRTIEIIDTERNSLGVLSTKANVVPANRTIQERYFYALGNLLYSNKTALNFGYVYQGKMSQKQIFIANASDMPMNIDVETTNTTELRAVAPYRLEAGYESAITITYTMPDDKSLFRTFNDTIWLIVNSLKLRTPITISAICMAKIDEQENAPSMSTYPSIGKLTTSWFSGKLIGAIELTNTGKTDLMILAIEKPVGIEVNIDRGLVVKPNQKIDVKVESALSGKFSINLFTNDPKRPFKELIFSNKN